MNFDLNIIFQLHWASNDDDDLLVFVVGMAMEREREETIGSSTFALDYQQLQG